MNPIEDFATYLLEKAGLSDLDEITLNDFRRQLQMELTKRIAAESLLRLPEGAEKEFLEVVVPKDDPNACMEYFDQHIENYATILKEIFKQFEAEFLKGFVNA